MQTFKFLWQDSTFDMNMMNTYFLTSPKHYMVQNHHFKIHV